MQKKASSIGQTTTSRGRAGARNFHYVCYCCKSNDFDIKFILNEPLIMQDDLLRLLRPPSVGAKRKF